MKNDHLMIDIETLDTAKTAVVLSIGAVKFNLEDVNKREEFYVTIDIEDSFELNRTISPRTLKWWLSQDINTRSDMIETSDRMYTAINKFFNFIGKDTYTGVWANSPDFDLDIIDSLVEDIIKRANDYRLRRDIWTYRNRMDFRTITNLYHLKTGKKWYEVIPNNEAHNALQDAVAQAKFVTKYYQDLVIS